MNEENKAEVTQTPGVDETGFINTEELRDVLKDQEEKKLPWYKRIFKRKNKK